METIHLFTDKAHRFNREVHFGDIKVVFDGEGKCPVNSPEVMKRLMSEFGLTKIQNKVSEKSPEKVELPKEEKSDEKLIAELTVKNKRLEGELNLLAEQLHEANLLIEELKAQIPEAVVEEEPTEEVIPEEKEPTQESGDSPEEPVKEEEPVTPSIEDVIKGINKMGKADLVASCVEDGCPEEEWKSLNLWDLRKYIIGKIKE